MSKSATQALGQLGVVEAPDMHASSLYGNREMDRRGPTGFSKTRVVLAPGLKLLSRRGPKNRFPRLIATRATKRKGHDVHA